MDSVIVDGAVTELIPPEKPLLMPIQNLGAPGSNFERPETSLSVRAIRSVLFTATLLLSAYATYGMYQVVGQSNATLLQIVLVGLFAMTFCWIAFSATNSLIGLLSIFAVRPVRSAANATFASPVAVVLPIFNEDVSVVFSSLQSMISDIESKPLIAKIDFFVLSDTTNLAVAKLEEEAALAAKARNRTNVFYRRRSFNEGKKSGNIAEFVRRWGGAYEYMIVLDADSYMSANAILTLILAMDSDQSAGLIQTVPRLRDGVSLFARFQQFASEVYGPVLAYGLSVWHGNEGNYWGHNAIIRVSAFAEACGLPILRGSGPFGGHILSHDFVEAALLRRQGFSVSMRPDIQGSFEGIPPTFADFAIRDRRWAQGNLQHATILPAAGLHWVSRLHLMNGIMSYLASPLWLAFLAVGLLLSWQATTYAPDYFPNGFSLFPTWPRFDSARALDLLGLSIFILLLPKLLGFLVAIANRDVRGRWGGAGQFTIMFLAELVSSALLAPVMMLVQSRFVAEILLGIDVGWAAQKRSSDRPTLSEVTATHINHVLTGILLSLLTFSISTQVWLWLSPIWFPLMVSVGTIYLTSGDRF